MAKKILYIIPRFSVGGAERLVLQYAKYFVSQNYKIAVVSTVGGGELVAEFEKLGLEIFVSQGKNKSEWNKLKSFVKNFSPDIIHTHVFSADVAGYLLSSQYQWISTQHNVGSEHSFFRKLILRIILKKARMVIAVGSRVEKFCLGTLRLQKSKVVILKNGIEIDKWLKVKTDKLFENNELQLAVIGRLEKQKGHKYLLPALAGLKNKNWQLHIYGAGSLADYLKGLSAKLGLTSQVEWHGVCNNLERELASIDVVIQPSLWEGLSLTIMEAMASGRLVITTPAGGGELITNKKTGLIVPAKDVLVLRDTLQDILDNRNSYKELGALAREYAQSNFSIANNFHDLENIYSKM